MKKRLLAIALTLCMALSLLPVAAFATESTDIPVAKIGETSYTSLTAAVNAVNTDDTITVTVLTGSSLDETVIIDKDITLDLGG